MVTQAVSVLHQLNKKSEGKQSKSLLEEDDAIHLHICLKKVPNLHHLQYQKIKLPHPLMIDTKDVCLITSDLDRKSPDDDKTVEHFAQVLRSVGITVGQIIPYHQLKTEYKTHESRRVLAKSYRTFLNDGRISRMMPVSLGTYFVRKKKMPISVSLSKDKVKQEFVRALAKTTLTLTGRGSSCAVKVGKMQQSGKEVCQNVETVVSHLEKHLPGKWGNVLSLHLKTHFSMAIPLYVSTESPNEVKMSSDEVPDKAVVEELNTLTHSKVKVLPSGKVTLLKKEADDVPNENTDVEQKMLSKQRYQRNKKKTRIEKKFVHMLFKQNKIKSRSTRTKGRGVKEVPRTEKGQVTKSPFGAKRSSDFAPEGLLRKRKKYPNRENLQQDDALDKSFEDSFSIQKRKTEPVKERATRKAKSTGEKYELKQIQVQETLAPESSRAHTVRLKLHSKRQSYSMLAKAQSNSENVNTQLLSFVKKGDVETKMIDKEEKYKAKTKFESRGTEERILHPKKGKKEVPKMSEVRSKKHDQKLSRMKSIRHSIRLAKGLM